MNIFFVILSTSLFIYILCLVIKNKFDIYESFFWVIASIIGIFLSIFPKSIDKISHLLGVDYSPALFLLMCIIFLLIINFRITKIITKEKEKVLFLAQEISIIKEKLNSKEK